MKREEGKKAETRRRGEEVREGKGGGDCRSLGMGEGTGGFILFVRSASRTTGKREDGAAGRSDVGHERQHAEQETAEWGGGRGRCLHLFRGEHLLIWV